MAELTDRVDLASERLGGIVIEANDEFFAEKENLLMASTPVFVPGKYTDRGKWIDGWETRRRRTPGHDWCIVRLGVAGTLHGIDVDTSHFTGNYPSHCSLDAAGDDMNWIEVLPKSLLQGGSHNLFLIEKPIRFTHVRLNIYPDGGVARLRVYGEALPDFAALKPPFDLAAVENGGLVLAASDMFFGSRHNLILPGHSTHMGDGWETKRRRGPGYDWVIVRLGIAGLVDRIVVETDYFKGNYPESCSIDACHAPQAIVEDLSIGRIAWTEIVARTKLEPDSRRELTVAAGPFTHVRLNIYPDGGVSRLRVLGRVPSAGPSLG
jgi:allantoicase